LQRDWELALLGVEKVDELEAGVVPEVLAQLWALDFAVH
jgi:hypothetical protein